MNEKRCEKNEGKEKKGKRVGERFHQEGREGVKDDGRRRRRRMLKKGKHTESKL